MNNTDPDNDDFNSETEHSGDDALRATESAERAALAGGADPLANLPARIVAEGNAVAFAPAVIAAAAHERAERRDRFVALCDDIVATTKQASAKFPKTEWMAAIKAHAREARAEAKASKRRAVEQTEVPTGLRVVTLGFDLARDADQCVDALVSCDGVFQRAGSLVRLVRAPGVPPLDTGADDAAKRAHERDARRSPDAGAPIIEGLPAVTVAELLSTVVEFRRRSEQGDRRVTPPDGLAARIVARRSYDPRIIRPLVGVVGSPVMLASGEILTAPGYHRESGLYLDWHGPPVEVPERPTRDDARAAAERIADVFCDFRMQGDEQARRLSVATCIAAVLTPLARYAVDGPVPAYIWSADAQSAGKTLLAQTCGAIVLGRTPAARPWCEDGDELQKTLGALALHAPPVALFDNARTHVESGALEAILTSDTYAARVLGASATPELPWRTTLYLTANHATFSADAAKRFRFVLMHGRGVVTAGEAPGETVRVFRHPRLLAHVLEHRDAYLRDALTILRAHVLAGRPAGASLDAFEAWAEVVAGAVLWAYDADPALAHAPAEANRDRTTARAVVAAWCVAQRERSTTLSALRERIVAGEPRLVALRDALADLADVADFSRATVKSLGSRLARIAGRTMAAPWGGTMRLDAKEDRTGVKVYTATSTTAPPAGEAAQTADGRDDGDDHPAARERWAS